MASDYGKLWNRVDERRDELIELCSQLVAIPSPNPPGNTTKVADFVSDFLSDLGLAVERYEPLAGAPNLVTHLGRMTSSSTLIFNGHLDTFPVADGDWLHPAFSGAHMDGRVYGCGASDMCAGLAISLFVAALLMESNLGFPGRLMLSYSSDEESGGEWGTEWLLNNVFEVKGDACLIGDQSGLKEIGVGEKGMCWLRLTTYGQSSHAAYGSSNSAVRSFGRILPVLFSLEDIQTTIPDENSSINDVPTTVRERVTVNVGTVHGGVSPNLVADSLVAEVDIRIPQGLTVSAVIDELRDRLQRDSTYCDLEILRSFDPTWTSPSSRLAESAARHARSVIDVPPVMASRLGASDARFFRREGIPTVVFGPTPHNMGGPNEYVEDQELVALAKVHLGIALDFLTERSEVEV